MGTGSFSEVKCGRDVLLTTHPLLVPRSWKSRAITLPTVWATPGLQWDRFTFIYTYTPIYIYTGCPRRNVLDFGRVFLMLNYTDITQNTYIQSWTVTEIMAREKCGLHWCRRTVRRPWRYTCPMRRPDQRDMVMQWPWRVCYSTVALTSQDNRSAAACVKYLEV